MRFLPSWESGGLRPGYLLDLMWHIALPVGCLVYGGFAFLSKQARSCGARESGSGSRADRAGKGVPERDVVIHHVVRNSLLPLITLLVGVFPAMLSGSVVIERVFNIPGMGSLILQAIGYRDRELLLATTMMVAAVNLLAMLLADVLYAWADPRVSYE
jgi:ABC-type dipeptide/oligopeptide/nickel transport system permease component